MPSPVNSSERQNPGAAMREEVPAEASVGFRQSTQPALLASKTGAAAASSQENAHPAKMQQIDQLFGDVNRVWLMTSHKTMLFTQ